MAITTKVTCDQCKADITDRRFHLRLSCEVGPIRQAQGMASIRLMREEPPLDVDKDFCGPRCLGDWIRSKEL